MSPGALALTSSWPELNHRATPQLQGKAGSCSLTLGSREPSHMGSSIIERRKGDWIWIFQDNREWLAAPC